MRYAAPRDKRFFDHAEWHRDEIQPNDLDKRLFALLKHLKTLLGPAEIPFWIAGSMMLNGLDRKLWRHMHDIDMFVRGADFERLLEVLRADGFIIHEEHNGWNRVEKDGCQIEICPATPLEGELYAHLRHGQEQVLHRYDLERAERGWLWGVPFRTISPVYMLGFYRFLREKFPKTRDVKADAEKMAFLKQYLAHPLNYWMPVTWYNGGMEHATLHMLYSRFWNKFLFDIGAAPTSEPYEKRTSHGMILAKGGEKMSKSKGNVVNPDEIVAEYGADTFRMYEMFMGPFDQAAEWDTKGLVGVHRFLQKVWAIGLSLRASKKTKQSHKTVISSERSESRDLIRSLHQTIRTVTDDIESMHFNTAVSALMELANEMQKAGGVLKKQFKPFVQLLSPFAPHIAEELWTALGEKGSITHSVWPAYNPELAREEEIELVLQVNGKVRDTVTVSVGISDKEAEAKALASEKIQKWLSGKKPKKVIVVSGKLVNVVL
ncbi:MAG: class I tRNA ligase family protein [Patescibacteria group bacterium]